VRFAYAMPLRPGKVEGLVRLLPGGGSSSLGRMKKALLRQGFCIPFCF
jgi:hypothetical protein